MEVTTKDLRLHTNAVLAAVDRGETVIVTFRGERRAVMTRWQADIDRAGRAGARNPAFGIWADREDGVEEFVLSLRSPRELL